MQLRSQLGGADGGTVLVTGVFFTGDNVEVDQVLCQKVIIQKEDPFIASFRMRLRFHPALMAVDHGVEVAVLDEQPATRAQTGGEILQRLLYLICAQQVGQRIAHAQDSIKRFIAKRFCQRTEAGGLDLQVHTGGAGVEAGLLYHLRAQIGGAHLKSKPGQPH